MPIGATALAFRSSKRQESTSDIVLFIDQPSGITSGDLLIFHCVTQEGAEAAGCLLYNNAYDGANFSNLIPSSVNGNPSVGTYHEFDTFNHAIIPNAVTGYGKRLFYTVIYKIAGNSEPATYEFAFKTGASPPSLTTNFDYCVGEFLCYSGASSTSTIDDVDFAWFDPNSSTVGTGRSASTSWATEPVTMNGGETLLSLGFVVSGSTATMTPPSGMTERTDNWQTGSGFLTTAADLIPGDSSSHTFTSSVSGTRGILVSAGIVPAATFFPGFYRRR